VIVNHASSPLRWITILSNADPLCSAKASAADVHGEDAPMATLLLSVMGAFAEFERALIRERQREGIALAKRRGQVAAGEGKAAVARAYGISRETLY